MNKVGLFLVCIILLISFAVVFPVKNVKTGDINLAPPTKIDVEVIASPTTVVVGETVNFTGSATGGEEPYKWDWNFGDDTPHLYDQNTAHSYSASDAYTAILNVTGANNTNGTDYVVITVNPALSCDAGGPYTGTICSVVTFAGTATGGHPPYTYSWTFGDGGTGSGQNPTHQYTSDGSYTATLTVTDNQLYPASDTAPVTITTPALVAEAGGPYTGTICNSVSFTGSATGGCTPYTYNWAFGDNGSGSGQNPTHQYTSDGSYIATLIVIDNRGITDTDTAALTISNTSLVAVANGPYTGKPGQLINFMGNASGGCKPYSYSWDFGDGKKSNKQNDLHAYTMDGIYTVTLNVTDNVGSTDNQIYEVVIDSIPPFKVTGLRVTDAKDGKLNLRWNPSTDNIAVDHYNIYRNNVFLLNRTLTFYQDTGLTNGQSYTYIISAVDTAGNEGNKSDPISGIPTESSGGGDGGGNEQPPIIQNKDPIADTSVGEPYKGYINSEILFNGSKSSDSDGNITKWFWDFDDNTNGTGKTIKHTYSKTGTYTVTLTVTDDDGATNTDITNCTIIQIQVNRPPAVPMITGTITGSTNKEYIYTATSTDPDNDLIKYTFSWNGTNIQSSKFLVSGTSFTVNHSWATSGLYNLTVTVTDNVSETDSHLFININEIEKEKEKTPGFELIIIVSAIALLILWKQKRKL